MLKFLRNTHDSEGECRWEGKEENPNGYPEQAKGISPARDKRMDYADFLIQMLSSKEPLSFEELVREVRKYEADFMHDEITSTGDIALALVALLEQDLAKTVAVIPVAAIA